MKTQASNIIAFPQARKCQACRGKGLITSRIGRILTQICCHACKGSGSNISITPAKSRR